MMLCTRPLKGKQPAGLQPDNELMLDYQQALKIIIDTTARLPAAETGLADAAGLICASSVHSEQAVPPFDNSAMDGFALRSADVASLPGALQVAGVITAGEAASGMSGQPGTAWEIMTGAPVPAGYDAMVAIERVDVQRDASGKPISITVTQPVAAGQNLRRAGEDFNKGDEILAAGQKICPQHIMGLAATGTTRLNTRRLPRITSITTGNELAEYADDPETGLINDSNGPYLRHAIPAVGAELVGQFHSHDSADELITLIERHREHSDIIVTTGGVSAGRMDFVPAALEQLGADILFHKVAIRPGKPILFARLPDGTLVFGLPGNPIAVAVGLRFFVTPALNCMQGIAAETLPNAKLAETLHKKTGLRFFGKALASISETGELEVKVLPGQESFKISPLMQANCWTIAEEQNDELQAGSLIRVAPLFPGGSSF
jgi:molybdopterin molybdotransferase